MAWAEHQSGVSRCFCPFGRFGGRMWPQPQPVQHMHHAPATTVVNQPSSTFWWFALRVVFSGTSPLEYNHYTANDQPQTSFRFVHPLSSDHSLVVDCRFSNRNGGEGNCSCFQFLFAVVSCICLYLFEFVRKKLSDHAMKGMAPPPFKCTHWAHYWTVMSDPQILDTCSGTTRK